MNSLHSEALKLSREHLKVESELVRVLSEIDETELYRVLGYSSLFTYVVSALGLSESAAYALITVVRKSREIEALRVAVTEGCLSVPRASRIARVLTAENAGAPKNANGTLFRQESLRQNQKPGDEDRSRRE